MQDANDQIAKDKAMAERVAETLQDKIKELKQALRDADDVTQSWT